MAAKFFWIKERHNPQLGVYYVACGQMTTKEARAYERSLYGNNYMHKFATKVAYESRIAELLNEGERVQ